MRTPHHILRTRTEPWGFIKSSIQNKVIHKELSLRLSCYLRRSHVGYTTGFLVEIVEALAHNLVAEFYGSARSNI
jgi:hypothetical protein